MKSKALSTVLISFVFALVIGANVFAFDSNDYPLSTIKEKIVEYDEYMINNLAKDETLPKEKLVLIIPETVPFKALAEYTGQFRALSETNKELLSLFGKSRKLDMLAIYDKEIKVIDSDGESYWIPIQKTFTSPMKEECQKGKKIILYLLWCIQKGNETLIVANEFSCKD